MRQKTRRLSALAMAIAGVLGGVQFAGAETFNWQGQSNDSNNPYDGNWLSTGQWTNGQYPPYNPSWDNDPNRASTELVFGGSDVNGAYTAVDDLDFTGNPLELNILRLRSSGTSANTLTTVDPYLGTTYNSRLRLVNNGSTAPRLIQDGSGAFNVNIPIEFSVNTIFSGAGTGQVVLQNSLTGAGAWDIQGGNTVISGIARITTAPSITFGNSGGGGALTLDGGSTTDRLADTIGVTFNVGGGTLAVGGSSGTATETVGTVTVNAGANRLQANGASTFTISTFKRNGGVVDFASTGGTLGASGSAPRIIFGNTQTLVNGILGGWATVNGTDFATYGSNGVTAYTGGYTPLPASNFSPTTIYEATGSVALSGGGDIFAVRLNHSANQTINLGNNNLNVTGGILKIGAGTTTISSTGGALGGGAGELVLHVNQGALNLTAPFTAAMWTKAGTGTLTINPGGNVPWQSVGFTGPLVMNVTADTTVSGQLAGAGSLTKNGNGKLTLTGSGTAGGAISGWSGGTTINAGTVELLATNASPNVNLAGGNSYLGSSGNININGGTLKVTTAQNGNTTGNINLTRAVVFGANGGLLDLTNSVGGTLGGGTSTNVAGFPGVTIGGGNSSFSLTTSANAATPAVIRFNGGQVGYADPATPRNWTSGNTVRFSSLNGTGALRVELSNGGSVRLGTGSGSAQNISVPFTISGTPLSEGGDSSSGPQGLNDPGMSKTTGRVVVDNAPSINHQNGLFLAGALQVAPVGASRALDGNITILGTASGNPGFVSFAGRGTGTGLGPTIQPLNANTGTAGQHPLWLGQGGNDTLTIEDGATASLDLRIRSDQNNHNGVFLDAQTVINAGGTLRFTQSMSASSGFSGQSGGNVGYHNVGNDITGQGTTAKESTIDLLLGRADTNAANLPVNGVNFAGTNVALVVNGSGLGGLRVNGKALPNKLFAGGAADPTSGADKIANLLTPERLAALTGTGGYLTIAPQSGTFALPSGGEWAAGVPVGLRVGAIPGGTGSVALPTGGTWAHNLHVDANATLGVDGVTVNNGTTPTVVSGLGTLNTGTGGVTFATGVTVAPGAAGVAGTLSAKGNAKLNAGATLKAEITGATYGSLQSTDSVDVTGSTLTVTPTNVTAGAHRYDVVVTDTDANGAGSVVGKFGTVNLPANESGQLGRIWSVVYEPTKVGVGFTIGGDANYDGVVNFGDLLALAKNYNKSGAQWTQGNFNPGQDDVVNFGDLLTLAKNYNRAVGADIPVVPGASAAFEADVAAAFAAVPEPGTLGFVGLGVATLLGGRRRRRGA
jgi:hypothetical protein